MKEESILYNGQFLLIKETDSKIFLHTDDTLTLIYLVEGNSNNFRRRIEFKKRNNYFNKYVTFSHFIAPSIAFSGELIISPENIVTGNISFQFLKENSTKILESYYISLGFNNCCIEYIDTKDLPKKKRKIQQINTITLENIEIFLFNFLNKINNYRCIKGKKIVPYNITINHILGEETRILQLITSLLTTYPQLQEFMDEYTPFERKRKKNY